MKVEQIILKDAAALSGQPELCDKAQLLLVFGSKKLICDNRLVDDLKSMYPKAYIMGCTTSGEIYGSSVYDDTLSATAVFFERSNILFSTVCLNGADDSYNAARKLAASIPHKGLRNIFVLSEGVNINGSKLVEGLRDNMPGNVVITGGLSGDGDRFEETYIIAGEHAKKNMVAIAAFYGDNIRVGYGSAGGWSTFGIERTVTRSKGTELFEIDGKPALDLYKEYLGDYSKELPASGLLFPLYIRTKTGDDSFVRTILGINERNRSLIFAGEIPEKAYCTMMKANFSSLVSGSSEASQVCKAVSGIEDSKLAMLISCIGRKLVLKQLVDEEIEAAREVLGLNAVFTGFYSYGEISPLRNTVCELLNQTMTITIMDEA